MATEIVGRYELLRPLGAGGMGEVFLGRDHQLERLVAIKRVNADNAAEARSVLHEARIVAALDHTNIAAVYDVVEHRGQPHVVMEFVDGPTLHSRIAGGPLSEGEVVNYGRQIADALAYAHARNVVHCDIKPSNVMLTSTDVPKVLDFGIAKRETPSGGGVETTASIRGTPAYMAPEVLAGSAQTYQSDIFSLGVTLYELAAGRRPFDHRAALAVTPETIERLSSRVSRELTSIILRAIEPEAGKRLQSAEEFRLALSQIEAGPTRTSRVVRRKTAPAGKTAALLGGLAVLCTALVLGVPRMSRTTTPSVLGVMMFNNSGDAENDYLAAGMADVLVSHLAPAPGVTVVPRTAMANLTKESQLPDAVKALGLTHVLAGSIQRSGQSLRMAISLLGDRGTKVEWSRSFDGDIDDVFHLQQRIARESLNVLRDERLISAETLNAARDNSPTSNADAFDAYSHGRVLLERIDVPGNLERAIELFTRAITIDANFTRAHAALGEAYWTKYRTSRDPSWIDRARGATLEALRRDAGDPTILFSLALIDHGTGQVDQAIEGLNKLLSIQPASDEAHRLLGRIYSEQSNFDRAIEELREADRIRPNYPLTIRALAIAYLDKGATSDAIASLIRLTELQPDNASAFQLLGAAYHTAGDGARALTAYNRANALAPRAAAFSNIGIIHHEAGDYAAAVDAYKKAISLQPREAITHRNLADAYWAAGDFAAARLSYAEALRLGNIALKVNPSNARTLALVGFCQAKLGQLADAKRSIERARELAPQDNEIAYKYGVILLLDGRKTEALEAIERSLKLGHARNQLTRDRDLDVIRNDPRFIALLR